MKRTLGIVLLAVGVLGCAARSRGSETVAPTAVAPLSQAMLGARTGGLVQSDAVARLLAAPEVTAAGTRLLGRLSQEPSLVPLYEGFTTALLQQSAVTQSLLALALAEPGVSADELTARVVARMSAGVDGPAFDRALDGALDRLFDRPPVDAAFERLADTMVERSRLSDRLAALMLRWRPELEAAVGMAMDDEGFGERLGQHLADPARSEALARLFSARVGGHAGLRRGLATLLDDDAFVRACITLVRAVLESPGLQENAALLLVGILDEVDAVELGLRVDRVLVTPAIEAAVVAWAREITTSEAFGALSVALGLVLEDPNLQAELLSIVVSAPAGHTA